MTTCLCPSRNGIRLAAIPWSSPTRPGCPTHPPTEICPASHRRYRSSTAGEPIATPCNTRVNDDGQCPYADQHA
jgi:hypothetical protein